MWVNGSLSHDSFKSECKICRKVSVFFFNYTSRQVEFSTESLINRSLNYHTSWHEHISNAKSKELFIDAIYKWQSLMERTWDWDYIFKLNNFLNSFQQYVHMWVSLQPWTKMESFSALHLLRHRLWELCICWLVVCFTLFPCLVQICFHATICWKLLLSHIRSITIAVTTGTSVTANCKQHIFYLFLSALAENL